MSDPNPPYKGLMMLEDVACSPYGWGESLWINKPTFEASLTALEQLLERRLAVLSTTVRVVGIRVTNPHLPRASLFRAPNQHGTFEMERVTLPWNVLLLRFAHGGYHANYNLGGVPGGMASVAAGRPTEAWQAAFDRYVEAVKEHCVIVNAKHMTRAEMNGEAARETVVNPVESVSIMRLAARKRGMGHFRPRGRRPKRQS